MIEQKAETNRQLHHLHAWLTPTPLCQVTNNFSLKQNFCIIILKAFSQQNSLPNAFLDC